MGLGLLSHCLPLCSHSCSRSAAWSRGSWKPGKPTTTHSKDPEEPSWPMRDAAHQDVEHARPQAPCQASAGSRYVPGTILEGYMAVRAAQAGGCREAWRGVGY